MPTQAVARDLLFEGMERAVHRGIDIFLHIHDQALALVREDEADEKLAIFKEAMEDSAPWATGIPVIAEGHISKWLIKD